MLDYRFAIELLVPQAKYGWLATDANDIYGKYDWIDWRDERKKPSLEQLETAWNDYVLTNGTPEEQQAQEKAEKQEALNRLKLSASAEVSDLLKVIS